MNLTLVHRVTIMAALRLLNFEVRESGSSDHSDFVRASKLTLGNETLGSEEWIATGPRCQSAEGVWQATRQRPGSWTERQYCKNGWIKITFLYLNWGKCSLRVSDSGRVQRQLLFGFGMIMLSCCHHCNGINSWIRWCSSKWSGFIINLDQQRCIHPRAFTHWAFDT